MSRLALAGIAVVLLVLTGFALWAASTTNRAAQHAAWLTGMNDAFQRAHAAATAEELLERDYRLHSSPDARSAFKRAAASLDAAVVFLQRNGDAADRKPIATLASSHWRYVQVVSQEFDAVDAGEMPRVLALHERADALFARIEGQIQMGLTEERDETVEGLAALRRHVVTTTPIALFTGLGLLLLFGGMLVFYQRRTERQAAQNHHQALHDGLTGLPNRTLLADRTGQAIRRADRDLVPAALALLDLDRFKEINDTLGHHYGDQLLVQVGHRLRGALRDADTVARLGGDEFAVLLPAISTSAGALTVADKLRAALAEPFALEGLTLDVEASIGLALYPDHGVDFDELLQRADIAMYAAKEAHTGFVVFDPTLDQHSPRRLLLLGELRRAIEQRQLVLHYQPKVDARTGRLLGAEALVRWQHPDHGLVQPGEFIPLAERTGLIAPLTHYVLGAALRQCAMWLRGGQELSVAVNVSTRCLLDLEFPEQVAGLLARWEVPARLLVVEITESAIMADPTHALQILARLNDMGVRLAIDDFGTGYSSMAYLKSLPVHELKVDRSFVSHMTTSTSDAVIVRSTVDLGRNLGLQVVAEGVEDQTTWRELDALGCDAVQGYYIGRPVPADELGGLLDRLRAAASNLHA